MRSGGRDLHRKRMSIHRICWSVMIVICLYVGALAGAYAMLGVAQMEWREAYAQWVIATRISADIDSLDELDVTRQGAKRPAVSDFKEPPQTHSIALWTVIETWYETEESPIYHEKYMHLEYADNMIFERYRNSSVFWHAI